MTEREMLERNGFCPRREPEEDKKYVGNESRAQAWKRDDGPYLIRGTTRSGGASSLARPSYQLRPYPPPPSPREPSINSVFLRFPQHITQGAIGMERDTTVVSTPPLCVYDYRGSWFQVDWPLQLERKGWAISGNPSIARHEGGGGKRLLAGKVIDSSAP